MMKRHFEATLVVLALLMRDSLASWLWLGTSAVGTIAPTNISTCKNVPGLTNQQLSLCQNKPDLIPSLSNAARLAIEECQRQFRKDWWNCSTVDDPSVFGGILQVGSKETAFLHAITAAALVHSVSRSCSSGNLIECACDRQRIRRITGHFSSVNRWGWSGCDDNVNYGVWLSEAFVDPVDDGKRKSRKKMARLLMNRHNNKAGRTAVISRMRRVCRCHGVSGSCSSRSCWNSAPHFQVVGDFLRSKYNSVVRVSYNRTKKKLRRKGQKKLKLQEIDLVYIENSPNYCNRNPTMGIPGTSGRICNKTSSDGYYGSCSDLCCGRGYNTKTVRETKPCRCRFFWCCTVTCETCDSLYDRQECK